MLWDACIYISTVYLCTGLNCLVPSFYFVISHRAVAVTAILNNRGIREANRRAPQTTAPTATTNFFLFLFLFLCFMGLFPFKCSLCVFNVK